MLFSSDKPINNKDFIGVCCTSNKFINNTVIVPFNCNATKLVFSIRNLANSVYYKAILYVNNTPTLLNATIADGSITFSAIGIQNINLTELDLISIYMDFGDNASLPSGVCIGLVIE